MRAPAMPARARRLPVCALAAGLLLGALVAGPALAAASDETPPVAVPRAVQDLPWGDSLFWFFQDRPFDALSSLMVNQHFGRMAHHADEAEVLRGGLLLTYGMHEEAGRVFEQLIARQAARPVRDRAWYYLARIRYQRDRADEAWQALQHIEAALAGPLEEDRQLLAAQVQMARGDFAGAAQTLDALTQAQAQAGPFWRRSAVSRFARYNLGVALVRSGQTARGGPLLEALATEPAADEEARALRDQANVALGFSALQQGRPAEARRVLERVRLNGPQSNKALLGFGWAAASLKKPDQALVPWAELAGRPGTDAAALEARIALPYAYNELGAGRRALALYESAIAEFDAESRRLDESIAAVGRGRLIQGLVERNPSADMGWFQSLATLPEVPHAAHLVPVLAGHEFQEGFKNYRDLLFLERHLAQWQEQLGVYGAMVDTRRQAFAQRLPAVREAEQAQGRGLAQLSARRDALAQSLSQSATQADGRAFADEREAGLLQRIARVQAVLERLSAVDTPKAAPGADTAPTAPAPDLDLAATRERLRLAAGALAWDLAQALPARRWEATKGLQAAEAGLAEARALDADLARAQREEPARFDAFAARLSALEQRLRALQPRVAALKTRLQQSLQAQAVAALQAQKDRLAGYSAQARFAVAQLHDHAQPPKDAPHAAPNP